MTGKIVTELHTKDVEGLQSRVEVLNGHTNAGEDAMDVALELIQSRVGSRWNKEDHRFTLVCPISNTNPSDHFQGWLQRRAKHGDVCRRSSKWSTAEDRTKCDGIDRNLVFQRRRSLVPRVQDPLECGVGGTLHRALRGVSNHHI